MAILCSMSWSAVSETDRSWKFRVFLDDKEIGQHRFHVTPRSDGTHVAIEASFDVKFLFLNVYSYRHNNVEIWQGGCVQSIESKTDDNGESFHVLGNRRGDTFYLQTLDGENAVEGCIKTFAYWDIDALKSTALLNAQTGELTTVALNDLGPSVIDVAGAETPAQHYRLTAEEITIDLWYSVDNGQWLGLQSTTRQGAVLRYRKL